MSSFSHVAVSPRPLRLSASPSLTYRPRLRKPEPIPTKAIRIIVPFAPRRLGRHHRAADRQVHRGQDRPALRGREQAGRQRHRRRPGGEGGAARRLHPDAGHDLDQRRQHPHVQESGLRPGEGLPGAWASSARAAPSSSPADSPYKTLADLLAYAKANPGKLELRLLQRELAGAGGGAGTKRAGVEWQGVAYKAIGNAWTDLYAGAIQFMFVGPHRRPRPGGGRQGTRPLALTLPQRSPLYPDLPALSRELSRFHVSTGFLAVAVPKATPLPVQERLNALINEAHQLTRDSQAADRRVRAQLTAAHARAVRRPGPRGARQVGGVCEDRQDRAAVRPAAIAAVSDDARACAGRRHSRAASNSARPVPASAGRASPGDT